MRDIIGLLIYFVSVISLFFAILLIKRYKYVSFFIFLVVGMAAMFRGSAGVDTHLYISKFGSIGSLYDVPLTEPLIPFLMWIVKFCGGSFPVFSLVYAVILSSLYYYVLTRFPNAIYFGITVFPVIFIDSLYNGMRVGLAYPLIFIAVARSSVSVLFVAASAHVSSMLAGVFKVFSLSHYLIFSIFIGLIFFLDISLIGLLPYRYISKMQVYSALSPSTSYAGLSDSAALCLALIIYYRLSKFRGKTWIAVGFVLLILVGFLYYFIISNYVAMLRLLRCIIICVFGLIARREARLGKFLFAVCVLFGMAYSANFLRQIWASSSHAGGGFLPLPLDLTGIF